MVLRLFFKSAGASVALASALALTVASCAEGPKSPMASALSHAGVGLDSRVYRLGIGDKLKITVFGEPDLSGPLEVNALGNLPTPLIGEIKAKGLTVDELRSAIAHRLAGGYLKDPKVSVEVANYRSFFVHGEVRNGGEFQFKNGLKLRDAVAMAGGYTYRAEKSHVLLTREGEGQEHSVGLPSDALVMPGDNVRIPERFF